MKEYVKEIILENDEECDKFRMKLNDSDKSKSEGFNYIAQMLNVDNPSQSNDLNDKFKESEENFDLSSRLHMHQVRFQQGMLKVAHLDPI